MQDLLFVLIVRKMSVPCRVLAHPFPATASLAMDLKVALHAPFVLMELLQ
jgi:hypothetical protein